MVDYRLHSSVAAAVFILILLGTRVLQDTLFLAICRQFALVGYNLPFFEEPGL